MSTGMAVFNGMNLPANISQAMLRMNANAMGGLAGGTVDRVSLRGSRFRLVVAGVESEASSAPMHVVVVGANPGISRIYYAGAYIEGEKVKPTCWSADGGKPHKDVSPENKQSPQCQGCPQDVTGSKIVNGKASKACSFKKRIVVVGPDSLGTGTATPLQLDIAAMSLFGDGIPEKGKFAWGGYMKALGHHKVPVMALVTKISFDESASVPKLFFSVATDTQNNALMLSEAQCEAAIVISESEAVRKMLEFTEDEGAGEGALGGPALPAFPAPAAPKPAPAAPKPAPAAPKPAPAAPKPAPAAPKPAPVPLTVATSTEWKTIAAEAGIEADDIEVLESLGGPSAEKGLKYWKRLMGDTPWQAQPPLAIAPVTAQESLGQDLAAKLSAFDDE